MTAGVQLFHYSRLWLRQARNYKESKATRHHHQPLPITKTRRAHLPWPDTSVHSLPKILWQPQVISKKYVLTEKEKILFKAFSFLMHQLTSSKYFLSGILWGLTFYKKLIFAQKRKKPSLLAQFILSLNSQRPTICGTLQAWKQSSKIHCTTHTGQALL